ncbi:hypothetical protein [Methanogenium cariaci]|uniref:hypothetical protein n=1 Tax=Methanogenium cariaci TaxID=2197 RepID=UPI0007855093|nr:hypothetical protein [Methanogenium cariaci]
MEPLFHRCTAYLHKLCNEIPERCVGSSGNRRATHFFETEISSFGWDTELQEFDAIDWEDGGSDSHLSGTEF